MTIPIEAIVRSALVVLGSTLAACVLFLLGHALWLKGYRRRRAAVLIRAHRVLNTMLLDGTPAGSGMALLRALPDRLQDRLLLGLSRSVSGVTRERLAGIAHELGVIRRATRGLRSRHWWRRLASARLLQALHVEGRLFLPLLKDPNVAVRAQAADWAGDYPSADVAEALVNLIDDTETLSRFAVEDSLLRLGAVSVAPLTGYLATRRGHHVLSALDIAVALSEPAFVAYAIPLCRDDVPEVRARAAELIGATGGREGTDVLVDLLQDPAEQVRVAAVRALGRIRHWPAAFGVAQRLRDPSWEVRHAAGLALRSLGSPGQLMLRRFSKDADRFAADMARQVLDLPRGVEIAG